ncbi:hypothetical protein [Bremerella cremea]|uniref:WD40 repeat domain-containing protein n=1 Tax=Bremerella cremea TaxID=1031537 RepID=UPI0031EEB2E6
MAGWTISTCQACGFAIRKVVPFLLVASSLLPVLSAFAAEGSVGFAHPIGILPDGTLILGMYGNSDASAVLSSPRWSRIDQVLEFNANAFPQRNPETVIVDSVSSVTSSADRTLHGFGCKSGVIWLWHSTSDTKERLAGHDAPVSCIDWGPGAPSFVSGSLDGQFLAWTKVEGDWKPTNLGKQAGGARAVAISPTGQRVATAGERSPVQVRPIDGSKPAKTFSPQEGIVTGLIFLDDELLAVSDSRNHISIWNTSTAELVRVIRRAHHGTIRNLVPIDNASGRLMTTGNDGSLRLWNWNTGEQLDEVWLSCGMINSALFDHEKQLLYLTSVNDGLMMIEVKEDNLAEIKNFPEPVLEEEP